MSIEFKKRFLIFMLPIIAFTVLMAIAVHFRGSYIQNTNLIDSNESQSYTMTMSSEISYINSISIKPDIRHRVDLDRYTIKITFDEPLKYASEYNLSLELTDVKQIKNNVSSSFKTTNPNIFYLARNTDGLDTIYETKIDNFQREIVYQSENIIFYALGKNSIFIVDYEKEAQKAKILLDDKEESVIIPNNYSIDSIDGSSVSDDFVFTLQDKETYERTLWKYNYELNVFKIIKSNDSESIKGFDAQYATDGKSIFYFDQSMAVNLIGEDSSRPPVSIGIFDEVSRILPLNKGLFGHKQNKYLTIVSSDGSELIAPETIQSSSMVQQRTNLEEYTYVKRELDDSQLDLLQLLIYYNGSNEKILNQLNSKERLILKSYLSPNDQYIVTEESNLPVIIDKLPRNSNAENVEFSITDIETGQTLLFEKGFDVKWRL